DTVSGEQRAALREAVEHTVERDPTRLVRVAHGLVASAAEIDDAEPLMREADRAVEIHAFVVGPAVSECRVDPLEHAAVHRAVAIEVELTGYATHTLEARAHGGSRTWPSLSAVSE